jgi:uncharacterized membrane protein
MRFALLLPWWGYVLAYAAAVLVAWLTYVRVAADLRTPQRLLLTGLRALTLVLLVTVILRPIVMVQASGPRESVVPILIDVSRSMRLADTGTPRIQRAAALAGELQQKLGTDFQTELVTFGETVSRGDLSRLSADARRSDLSGAITAIVDRYRGQRLAGLVVLSDGGDTAGAEAGSARKLGVPVFPVGIGDAHSAKDREVINVTAGAPVLSESSVDLSIAVASHGFGTTPIEVRVSENGRPLEVRRITPAADGAPVHEVFTVSPSPDAATVYGVEIPGDPAELTVENNVRRVLVPPQGRRRRVLVVEGAPGFEHTFLKRALTRDSGLEVDSVVRKGKNDEGRDTFFVQAGSSRSASLANGYPLKRAELFMYDAVIFGNIEGDFFSREQLSMTAEFVAERGGGLLVLGGRSFERAGLVGTPLEEVLPVDLTDRRSSLARVSVEGTPAPNGVALTADGSSHPATRLTMVLEESRKRWSLLPPLPAVASSGAPRPGAQVLAVMSSGAELRPLIVTQRYGLGRAMVFTGEASWRWRMLLPAADTTHELIWRQLTRWLAAGAVEAIEIPPVSVSAPGATESVAVTVRNEEFKPVVDAEVVIRVQEPGGQERSVNAALSDPSDGRYSASVRFDQAGVYIISADVRRGQQPLGSARRPTLVGGVDVEMSEPRLNEAVLRRIAESTGGRYVPAAQAGEIPGLLRDSDEASPPMEMRDVWHNGWTIAVLILLLGAEWFVRRGVGLA